jgi:prepilin-type N-terminal cleavage/methylation domain-containing protein
MTMDSERDGFTLLEISIVLTIIALIVGGVLVGKDLIRDGQIQRTIAQKGRFEVAVQTFIGKYNCIPGDCKADSKFGLDGHAPWGMGDGDEDGYVAGGNSDESKRFWKHLYDAGLFTDTAAPGNPPAATSWQWYGSAPSMAGVQSPGCPICKTRSYTYSGITSWVGGWGFTHYFGSYSSLNCGTPSSWTSLGGVLPPPRTSAFILSDALLSFGAGGGNGGAINSEDAAALDSKIDDGKPLTGQILAIDPFTYSDAACSGNNGAPAMTIHAGSDCVSGTAYYGPGLGGNCNMVFVSTLNF